jgi:hypothetical protein
VPAPWPHGRPAGTAILARMARGTRRRQRQRRHSRLAVVLAGVKFGYHAAGPIRAPCLQLELCS